MPTYNLDVLEPFFIGNKRHPAYFETVKMYEEMRVHVNGDKPWKLLRNTRPNEPPQIVEYRLANNQPVTKQDIGKVETSLSKIPRADGWSIQFNEVAAKGIAADETPYEYYCEKYPFTDSIQSWIFDVNFKTYMADANALIMILPNKPKETNLYPKPYPMVFTSEKVFDNNTLKAYIFASDEPSEFLPESELTQINLQNGAWETDKMWTIANRRYSVFYVVDETFITKWSKNANSWVSEDIAHGLPYAPVVEMAGKKKEQIGKTLVKETRFAPMVYSLNKAIVLASDIDAARIMHLFPERWEYRSQKCAKCQGSGSIMSGSDADGYKSVPCTEAGCENGYVGGNPFKTWVVTSANKNLGQQDTPTPTVGYIIKPIDIFVEMCRQLDAERFKALAAVNMENLATVPLATSGVSKAYDRDEQDTFGYAIAGDQRKMINSITRVSNDIRYAKVPETKRKELMPAVSIPTRYNLMSASGMIEAYGFANTAGLDPIILMELQIDLTEQTFQNNEDTRNKINAVFRLNPLATLSPDEVLSQKAAGNISKKDAVIYNYIASFVNRAVIESKTPADANAFYKLSLDEQKALIDEYAEEKIEEMDTAIDLMPTAPEDSNGNTLTEIIE